MSEQKIYKPDGQTLERYLDSNPYSSLYPFGEPRPPTAIAQIMGLECVQGPVRSGKSVASIMRIYEAMMNVPKTMGKRRSRWLVVRNTYGDLEASTIKTWLEWFPEKLYGRFMWTPPYVHIMRFGDVEAEVTFESFAGEEDIPSLKSREYTGVWVNEAQFYSRKFIVALYERTGWFPKPGLPKFVQLDMNAPPLGHWVPMMRGDTPIPEEFTESERRALIKPADWSFLVQPPWFIERLDAQGSVLEYDINPLAENLSIVGERAVRELLNGRTKDEIDADLMNRVTIMQSGRPVFPMFVQETHLAKKKLEPVPGYPVIVGLDFGRQPAAVFTQCVNGQWRVIDELIGTNVAANVFAPMVKRRLAMRFPGYSYRFWGDPSGVNTRSETDDNTAFDVFKAEGMLVERADNAGRRTIRIETATHVLNSMVGGAPKLLVSPSCPALATALGGGYIYRRKKVSGAPVYDDEPHKNEHSHVVDALLEVLMGGGESRAMLGRGERRKPTNTVRKANPYDRGERAAVFSR